MKKIILNIINKISYMIYLISVLSISVFLLMYIFTDDINFYIDKIREIDNKIFQVRDIIDGK